MTSIEQEELRMEDLLAAFEKLKAAKVEGNYYRLVVSEGGFSAEVVPPQEGYQCGMVDRKADNLPLWMWDGVE